AAFNEPVARSQAGVVSWQGADGRTHILAGAENYTDGTTNGSAVRQYDLFGKTIEDAIPAWEASVGPLALGDLEGHGQLELLVGGRVLPGRYPEPTSSKIYRYDGHQWRLDAEKSGHLENAGLVKAALLSDLDNDGFPEIVLASDWGPIRIFHNNHGTLAPWDPPLTWPAGQTNVPRPTVLSQLTGWWNGVTSGDFDGDGRLDLAVSNWGQNTKYQADRAKALSVYYGDLAGDESVQLVEAYYEPELKCVVPERQLSSLAKGLPWLRGKFDSNKAFSTASVQDVLGERLATARVVQANCLESIVLLNRGDHFEVRLLPVEAQMAPAFGICVADFDGDGNEDLFLAQNFFATQHETARYDAGLGLLLLGDGRGGFRAVSAHESGIVIYGEQRGAASGDFDGDGRVDLAVGQNAADTKLFHNRQATPGLRVRLRGPPDNPEGVGAVIRLKAAGTWRAAREVHAGSGYWSQDSRVQVLGPQQASEVEVRWPGGKLTTNAVPSGTRELTLSFDGRLLQSR
ncbi:MAG TPA: CRTAC1 family protein, partial [Verrucomicrobiae bacterium]|nr:CRTAC1 family protein [Verrucomicrobiae bacterium]